MHLPMIGRGKTKTVYALDAYTVLKVGPADRIAKQARRLRRLHRLGVPVARVLCERYGWLVQEQCEGSLAEVSADEQALVIAAFRAVLPGMRIGDLRPRNVMWHIARDEWVIVDCGAIRPAKEG